MKCLNQGWYRFFNCVFKLQVFTNKIWGQGFIRSRIGWAKIEFVQIDFYFYITLNYI